LGNLSTCACGGWLRELVDLGLELLKGYEFVLGIKRWFYKLFGGYLVEESMPGLRVLIGKRKNLILDYKEEQKERILWCLGIV
jgi:hypothetical protein